jgi:tRNA threonylcarbamoyladenosine biosynthesis protein TsaB
MNDKPLLALETSQSICSVCIFFNDEHYFEASMSLKNAHAEKIFELIDGVLRTSGISLENLEAVAVSAGPGSFTGLRIGMSAAKGIAYGLEIPVISVPTFEAMALEISTYLPEGSDFAILNKVNMDEVYFAGFKVIDNSYIFTEKLEIVNKTALNLKNSGRIYFGNAVNSSISAPGSKYIAKWGRKSGTKISPEEIDNIEPFYLKNFIIKEKNK